MIKFIIIFLTSMVLLNNLIISGYVTVKLLIDEPLFGILWIIVLLFLSSVFYYLIESKKIEIVREMDDEEARDFIRRMKETKGDDEM